MKSREPEKLKKAKRKSEKLVLERAEQGGKSTASHRAILTTGQLFSALS
jgi:hypothetical protein